MGCLCGKPSATENAAADAKVAILANIRQVCVCVIRVRLPGNGKHRKGSHVQSFSSFPQCQKSLTKDEVLENDMQYKTVHK
jgi:hypothetical protein